MLVQPLSRGFGAKVTELSVQDAITDDAAMDRIFSLLFKHRVLHLPNQQLDPHEIVSFSSMLGPLAPVLEPKYQLAGHPELVVVGKSSEPLRPALRVNDKIEWHFDYAHSANPALAAVLYASVIPARGGDTKFADSRAAFEALPQSAQRDLGRVMVEYSWAKLGEIHAAHDDSYDGSVSTNSEAVIHPLVRTHPVTGRRAILIAPEIYSDINIEINELEKLVRHCCSTQFIYQHQWTVGDLVIYDNLSQIHTATPVPGLDAQRRLIRATVQEPSPDRRWSGRSSVV